MTHSGEPVRYGPGATGTDEVLFATTDVPTGRLGRILLNRPKALNALTDPMVGALARQLETWSGDQTVTGIEVRGTGPRGLCSGGDVRLLRDAIQRGGDPVPFWATEYALNALIADYPKPITAVMNGIVMGGGLGVSAHATHRLATPSSRFAMPETIIGFFPDVGISYLLARAPGELGTHVVMTGGTVGPADAVLCGLADTIVAEPDPAFPDDVVPPLLDAPRLDASPLPVEPGPLAAARDWIDRCYTGDDPVAIVDRLAADPDPDARAAADTIRARCPFSVHVSLAAIRRAARLTRAEVFAQDLALARSLAHRSDLVEGIRAQLVDRDHDPHWQPATLAEVDRTEVAAAFADASVPADGPV